MDIESLKLCIKSVWISILKQEQNPLLGRWILLNTNEDDENNDADATTADNDYTFQNDLVIPEYI